MPHPSTATPDGEREEEGSSQELPHKERDMLDIKWGSMHHKKTTQVRRERESVHVACALMLV